MSSSKPNYHGGIKPDYFREPECSLPLQATNVKSPVPRNAAERHIIHNSDYQSVDACKAAIDRHFAERNQHFKANPQRAGDKIWGKERVLPVFDEANNCKDVR